jgi:hypothetical protein
MYCFLDETFRTLIFIVAFRALFKMPESFGAITKPKATFHHVRRKPAIKPILEIINLYLQCVPLVSLHFEHFSDLISAVPPRGERPIASRRCHLGICSLQHSWNARASARSGTSLYPRKPSHALTFFLMSMMFFMAIVATISWQADIPHWHIRNCSDLSLFLGFFIGS